MRPRAFLAASKSVTTSRRIEIEHPGGAPRPAPHQSLDPGTRIQPPL